MDLKQIAAHSQKMNITEHELGNFLKNKNIFSERSRSKQTY